MDVEACCLCIIKESVLDNINVAAATDSLCNGVVDVDNLARPVDDIPGPVLHVVVQDDVAFVHVELVR